MTTSPVLRSLGIAPLVRYGRRAVGWLGRPVPGKTLTVPGSTLSVGALGFYLCIALVVFLPLLGPGYLLKLDMVSSPNLRHVEYLFRAKDPLYYGRLPVAFALDSFSILLPQWAVQKVVLVGIVAGSGVTAHLASRSESTPGALFAGTLYAVNPFVYVRLLAGHWWFLLGYAVVPLAVVAFADALSGRGGIARAAAWTTIAAAIDPHVAVLLAVAYACVGPVVVVRSSRPRAVLATLGKFGGVTVTLSAYWLAPALAMLGAGSSKVATMDALDLVAFSARGSIGGNVPLSVAALFGFWRGGYRLPSDLVPLPAYLFAFAALFFLAATGWYHRRGRALESGLAVVGVAGFVLALGAGVDATEPLFRFLYEHAAAFRGMRDSQKFVALLALAYALLGARGVDHYAESVDHHVERVGWLAIPRDGWRTDRLPDANAAARTAATLLLVVAVVALPLLYTWPMLGGFSGQLSTTEYPEGWATANDELVEDPGTYRVLFLPWHGYLTFSWTDGRVANPADAYFERPVVRGRSLDVGGVESHAPSPTHERVGAILEEPTTAEPIGGALAPLGVKYVIVARTADYRRYDYLRGQPDLVVVEENDDLVLLENRAYEGAPPREAWPRAWPAVPWAALFGGSIVSVAAAGVLLARRLLRGSGRRLLRVPG